MITLLASIAGFISSIIPEILKLFKDYADKKHELNILDRKMANNTAEPLVTTCTSTKEEITEQNALYTTYKSGINLVDALNGAVRPVLAYSFFGMYAGVKFVQYRAIKNTAILAQYLDVLWSVDDQAIFAGIISFYFGRYTFNKFWQRR